MFDSVEKAALFYYISSICISISKLTGEEAYIKETHKSASSILDTMIKDMIRKLKVNRRKNEQNKPLYI